jgi:predicted nucleic acid-binding protein
VRPLPAILVLDATVVISAALGRTAAVIERAHKLAVLVTTDRAIEEARRRIELGLKAPEFLPQLAAIAESVAVVPSEQLAPRLPDAVTVLRDAVASRNGSTRDAHVLALAWASGGDIWSADRDFAGTGVASWSTLNLVRALAQAEA